MNELKEMVSELINNVRQSRVHRKIAHIDPEPQPKPKTASTTNAAKVTPKLQCPKCKSGKVITGRNSHGCANFKNCNFRIPFKFHQKKITTKQLESLVNKGKTNKLTGFKVQGEKTSGKIILTPEFLLKLES